MLNLTFSEVDHSERLDREDIHFHQSGIEVDGLYFDVLDFVTLFYERVSVLELNVVDSRAEDT